MSLPLPMKRYDPRRVRTWADIDLSRLAGNVHVLNKSFAPTGSPDAVMAIVKADAYGHGAVAVARVCAANGIDHFGVATVEEGLTLRKAGVRSRIYLLSAFVPDEAEAIVRGDIIPILSSPEHFHALADAAKSAPLPARAFIAVDTGMGREGMLPDMARSLWKTASTVAQARLVGITSHLSSADECDPVGTSATQTQVGAFATFIESLAETFAESDDGRGQRGIWLSLCNSPATIRRQEWSFRVGSLPGVCGILYRAGLLLYGIEPYSNAFQNLDGIQQILTWRACMTLIRDLPAGATVGYGRTHTLERPSRIATVAVGYADGFPRRLSDKGHVLLQGQLMPIVGRVSMDQLQIDVTNAQGSVNIGDPVTILGTDSGVTIPILSFADSIGATAHEPTCYLTSRVPRLYTNIS